MISIRLPNLLKDSLIKAINPWHGIDGGRVVGLRWNLERLTVELSTLLGGSSLHVRYNKDLKCTEIYRPFEKVIIQISVHGMPEKAFVCTTLPPSARVRIVKALPLEVEFVEVL